MGKPHTHAHMCVRAHARKHICTFARTHARTHVRTYARTHVSLPTHRSLRVAAIPQFTALKTNLGCLSVEKIP